jgi:hypothetical protein
MTERTMGRVLRMPMLQRGDTGENATLTLYRYHEIAQGDTDRFRLQQETVIRLIYLGIPPLDSVQRSFRAQSLRSQSISAHSNRLATHS